MTCDVDVVIVGAGPAGMAAASALAQYRAKVVVLDEQGEPGGQIYKSIETVYRSRPADIDFLGPSYFEGDEIVKKFRAEDIDYRPRSTVWHIGSDISFKRRDVFYSRNGTSNKLRPKYIVIATGAIERPVPIEGWTLPGVMTAGAVQSALKTSGIYPSGKLALVGSGPLVLQLANQLLEAHIPISAIVDTTPTGSISRAVAHFPRAITATDYLLRGWKMIKKIKKSGVKVYQSSSNIRVNGDRCVEGLSFISRGVGLNIPVDVVALHEGVIPNTQLTRLLSVDHAWNKRQRAFFPILTGWGETSIAGVFVAGDGGGISGAKSAILSGEITGRMIAQKLDLINESARDLPAEEARLKRLLDTGIRPLLEALYPAPDWIAETSNETLICRCEEITSGQLRTVISQGCYGPNQAKAFLRCGMGACQGRMCGATVTEIIARELRRSPSAVGSYNIRPPIKPISLGELASLQDV